jgi:hypothetical protein
VGRLIASVPPCGASAAKAAILASTLPDTVKVNVRTEGAGVDKVICLGRVMAATVFSGGTAGDTSWAAFRRTATGWKLIAANPQAYKVGLFVVAGDLVESQPIYLANDANCCPTGGFAHRRFQFDGQRLRAVRSWVDKSFRPAGALR